MIQPETTPSRPGSPPTDARPTTARGAVSRRAVLAGSFLIGGSVVLAACTDSSARSSTGSGSARAARLEVTDNGGRVITFNRTVSRVVAMALPAASLMIAVDRSPRHLVGMHNTSWVALTNGILGQFFPDILRLPHEITTNASIPNVQHILDLQPDVAVEWNDSPLVEPLENAGLIVIGVTDTGTQDDVESWIQIFATMLDIPQRATQMRAHSDAALARATAQSASRTATGPSILFFTRFTEGLTVAAAETYNDSSIRLVGATNPATGFGLVSVDIAQVLVWNPEVILVGNDDTAMPEDIYSNPAWSGVRAVTNRRVYKVPLGGGRWDAPSQESPLMLTWLADIAYPDRGFSTLRAQIEVDYAFLYGHTPTKKQIDTVLWLQGNERSSHYEQFISE